MRATPSRDANRARYAVIDVETTGLDPASDRIVECAIVELDEVGHIVTEWTTLVAPPRDVPITARHIHHITPAMLEKAPSFAQLSGELARRLQGRVLVGHVLEFDLATLRAEFERAGFTLPELGRAGLCTREMARAAWPTARHHLRACCSHAHIRARGFHTALGDARATAKLLSWFLAHDRCSGIAEIADGAASLNWPSPPRAAVACYPRRAGLRTSRALASLLSQLFAKRANGAQTKPSSAAAREVSTSSSSA